MKWLKKNRVKVLLLLVHTLVLARLLLDAYQVELPDPFIFIFPVLRIAVPAALIGIAATGLLRDLKPAYLILGLAGALFLWQTYDYDAQRIVDAIRFINEKLSAGRPLIYRDFSYLIDNSTLLITALSFLTLYVYPWNLLVMDLSFLFFLWAVDSLPDIQTTLTPMILLWAFLFVHDRLLARDHDYADYDVSRIDRRSRMLQGTAIAVLIGLFTVNVAGESKGTYYERLWMRANDYLMQDDFMPGNYFLDSFSLGFTGYQDSSTRLGGDVSLNNNIALRVRGEEAPEYLRGNTKRVYTGSLWKKSDHLYRTDNTASELITDSYGDAPMGQITVEPAGVRTASLFVPIYPDSVTLADRSKDNRVYYSIQDQTFMVNEIQTEAYSVWYYDQPSVEALAMGGLDGALPREYLPYLELPDTITQRTVDLVAAIIDGIPDQGGRMLAITDYLRTQYEYTLEPGNAPSDRDFVDHFLFEVEEGYCVYYATALTVMLRIAGIPARYAEGFKVSSERDSQGDILVRNSDAHAWTEVLTDPAEGLWTIWDATGTPREQDALGGGTGSNPEPAPPPGESTQPPRTLAEDTLPDPAEGPGENPVTGGGGAGPALPGWSWFLLAGAALAAAGALWHRHRRRRLLETVSDTEFLETIVRILGDAGMAIEDAQTLTEITRHIVDADLQRQFSRFVQAHYRARYGQTRAQTGPAQRGRLLDLTLKVHHQNATWGQHLLRQFIL